MTCLQTTALGEGEHNGDSIDQVEGKPVPIYVLIQTHSKGPGENSVSTPETM
jgi:hypothetical protein